MLHQHLVSWRQIPNGNSWVRWKLYWCWTNEILFDKGHDQFTKPSGNAGRQLLACVREWSPNEFKDATWKNGWKIKLVLPNTHWQNIAEKVIQIYNGHFVSVVTGVYGSFPIHQWDLMVLETVMMLNLLWQLSHVLKISYVHGTFGYN